MAKPAPSSTVEAQAARENAAVGKAGIYVHIPFCAAICNYCNFNRGLHDESIRQRYVEALIADIRSFADPSIEADTIFFGGGTPSLLQPVELGRII
ncbi:MAG TPA: radical SAM protein, partial [Burkholderiaceae bacterium]|nr:radical SAM protein [Burkholderiaceae bacterium]